MELHYLFRKREEVLLAYSTFPVGSLDWEKCRLKLDELNAQIMLYFDTGIVDVDQLMVEVFGTKKAA